MRSGYAPPLIATPAAVVSSVASERDVTSVSTTREIGGGGVPGESAAAAADGSVEWAGATTLDGPSPSPWTREGQFPPVPGSPVTVAVGTVEAGIYSMLTGVVDSSSAGSDGVVSSTIVDPVDRLHRRVNLPAYLYSMQPLVEGERLINVGLSSDWVADIILRRCAYFTTPYMGAAQSGVNVPGTGSMIPERGTVTAAGRYGEPNLAAQFLPADWGWGIHSADATYEPEGTIRASTGFMIASMVSLIHSGPASIKAVEGAGEWRLNISAGRNFSLAYNGATVASLPGSSETTRVEARISAGSVALVTDDGRQASGPHPAPSAVTTAPVSSVQIIAQAGARFGGVMVADQPSGTYNSYRLNARMRGETVLNPALLASPRVDARDGLAVLSEIANATCRAFWWDEDGVFQWVPGDTLLARSPSLTLRSRDSLSDLGWSEALADTYRSVTVDYQVPGVSISRRPNIPLWQGSGQSLDAGQSVEEIAAPSTTEEWIGTQWSPTMAGGTFQNEHNHGRRSVWGGVVTDGDTTTWAGSMLSSSLQSIGNTAMKYTFTSSASLPANKSVQLAFPNDDAVSGLWRRWRNEKLPILRGYGRVDWVDDTTTAGSGPSAGGDYAHDGGKWAQGVLGETPGRIADFLAAWLCTPHPRATGVQVIHDPRIQVGDVVTVRDEHAHGVELVVLVTRVSQSVSAKAQSMELDFFVISGSPAWRTLGEHDAAGTSTLAAHNTQEPGESMGEHNADPWHLV